MPASRESGNHMGSKQKTWELVHRGCVSLQVSCFLPVPRLPLHLSRQTAEAHTPWQEVWRLPVGLMDWKRQWAAQWTIGPGIQVPESPSQRKLRRDNSHGASGPHWTQLRFDDASEHSFESEQSERKPSASLVSQQGASPLEHAQGQGANEDFASDPPSKTPVGARDRAKCVPEFYKELYQDLQCRLGSRLAQVVALCPVPPAEQGLGQLAQGLAGAAAAQGKQVLLVFAQTSTLSPGPGLTELLAQDQHHWRRLLRPGVYPGVQWLPPGKLPWSSLQAGVRSRLVQLLGQWRKEFDWVLVVGPPVEESECWETLAEMGQVLLVLSLEESARADAQMAQRLLRRCGGEVAGCIVLPAQGAPREKVAA